jgi:putative DNA primase/helicase
LEKASKFVKGLATASGIAGVLEIAKSTLPVSHPGGGWERNPLVVGAPNGVIDLTTGLLMEGKPEDMITLSVRPTYVPDANGSSACPTWTQSVLDMCDGDEELATYLQRAVGYSITGLNEEQAYWMLFGPGSNGKSTFLETVAYVLGDYAWSAPSSTFDHGGRRIDGQEAAGLVEERGESGHEQELSLVHPFEGRRDAARRQDGNRKPAGGDPRAVPGNEGRGGATR